MSEVYFAKVGASKHDERLPKKVKELFDKAGFAGLIGKNEYVALKAHFGEPGNTTFLRPQYMRQIVDKVKESGGKPFLTDANTLYTGQRSNAIDHLNAAYQHGFLPAVVDAPVIIADGLTGRDFVEVEVNLKHLKTIKYGTAAYHAHVIAAVSHFKCHMVGGIGGAIKNIGMGFGSRAGKQQMHSDVNPKVNDEKCIGCKTCLKWCPEDAITIVDGKALISQEKCIGCGECMISCPTKAINVRWDATSQSLQEKMAEYTYGILKDKMDKCFFFNFVLDVTPDCDCVPWSGAPIVPDVGIVASTDPVAIDQASADLVNQQRANIGSKVTKAMEPGEDKIHEVHNLTWDYQLKYGEKIGLGSRKYKIIEI
ncbi:MAG: DUF362 domain-containing protein [Thermoplasmata archaeon]|nr:DUF362 domain-containing protein [Thermoplasmata archaeon]